MTHARAVQSGPMIRRLFIAASAISLLLCLGVLGLWIWSYQVPESVLCEHRLGLLSVRAFPGGIYWDEKVGIERVDWSLSYWQIVLLTLALPLWPLVRRFGKWVAALRE